jgi:PadR family transcriptional regulator, regulatory protein PadR
MGGKKQEERHAVKKDGTGSSMSREAAGREPTVKSENSTKSDKSDLPQGTLDLLVLKVVTLGPIHGYAIAQRIQQISRDVLQVQQGSLYPALHRLENKGFLGAEWRSSDTGREAKFYHLTKKGKLHLQAETANWQQLARAVRQILDVTDFGSAEEEAI